jgi:hypothetical protein
MILRHDSRQKRTPNDRMNMFSKKASQPTLPYSALPALIVVGLLAFCTSSAPARLVITPTFTSGFNSSFGVNAAAAQASWIAAANVFAANFNDNIHVNITVDAVPGTGVFGQSSTFLNSLSYSTLRGLVSADAHTADDATALASMGLTDPVGGTHTWWVSRAEAKAIGLIGDDLSNDGTTTFGAGNPFTFSGAIAPGTYDFQGIAAHEISEVLGRLGISGGTIGGNANSYSLIDLFSYSGLNARGLTGGPGNYFSIDGGANLLKLFNNPLQNGLDSRDWAPGSNDSFNQFSNSGVVNPVSDVDLRLLDVLGYDRVTVPEPGAGSLLLTSLALGAFFRRRIRAC